MRLVCALLALALIVPLALAQDRQTKSKDLKLTLEAEYTVERAAYTRELWVGIPGAEVNADDLRKALAKACDDTTSVAVITPANEGSGIEQQALASLTGRNALLQLATDMMLMGTEDANARKHVRIVLVGIMESCLTSLRIAADANGIADGVVLIDPPVEDLLQIAADARPVGVDVLLHPRSDAEFGRETDSLIQRLGPWGKGVRLLRGHTNFGDLDQRVAEAWMKLRTPKLMTGHDNTWSAPSESASEIAKDRQVVYLGELHGNPGAHRAQLEFLRAMADGKQPLALSTEQFERDVQPVLDDYLAGKITEAEFLKNARPWPNYADYRPLIEFCKEKKIPVLAANIPRKLASRVNKEGPEVVEKFTEEEKAWSAAELHADTGAYRNKFMEVMGGADGHNAGLDRMYAAQCFKDDTMAESIANWLKANPKGRVLHINGAFHSGGGLGVPEKLAAMMPDLKYALVTCVEGDEEVEPAVDEWIIRVPASRPMRE